MQKKLYLCNLKKFATMKNRTLPVKSCNRRIVGLYAVLCILSVLTVFFSGCKDQNKPESFVSDQARPTWTAIEVPDMSSSMTAVIKVDLKAQYPNQAADFVLDDNDLLAAFSGDLCLGTATPQDGLFYLFVAGINDDPVTLRYYSAHYKNLFEAKDAFPFQNDAHLGTVAEPFVPTFTVGK